VKWLKVKALSSSPRKKEEEEEEKIKSPGKLFKNHISRF
jgi:hypothetical protein